MDDLALDHVHLLDLSADLGAQGHDVAVHLCIVGVLVQKSVMNEVACPDSTSSTPAMSRSFLRRDAGRFRSDLLGLLSAFPPSASLSGTTAGCSSSTSIV